MVDNERKILVYNKAFLKLWNLREDEVDNDSRKLLDKVKKFVENPYRFVQIVEEIYSFPEKVIKDTFRLKDGRVFERYSYPFKIDDKVFGRVWYSKDITENLKYEEKLKKLATTDALTGLLNRRRFTEILQREIKISQRSNRPFVLIMFDIDDFKKINDKYGHDAGDYVLKKVAEKTSLVLRETDIFARWGGEEFLILCPDTNLENGKGIAYRILKKVNEIRINSQNISASIGITEYMEDDTEFKILKRVDSAMYRAKTTGKNKVAAI